MIEAWLQKVLNRIGTPAGADLASDIAAQSAILEGFQPNQRLIAEYEADGDIAQGDFVGITSEGKATTVGPCVGTPFSGTTTQILNGSASSLGTEPVFLPGQNKVAVLYTPNSTSIYIMVGMLESDGTITWSSPQDTTFPVMGSSLSMCAAGTDRLAIHYFDNIIYRHRLVLITLDGISIDTIGSPTNIFSEVVGTSVDICYPYDNIVVCARSQTGSTGADIIAASLSGTTVTSIGTQLELISYVSSGFIRIKAPNSTDGIAGVVYREDSGSIANIVKVNPSTLDLTRSVNINDFGTYWEDFAFPSNNMLVIVNNTSTTEYSLYCYRFSDDLTILSSGYTGFTTEMLNYPEGTSVDKCACKIGDDTILVMTKYVHEGIHRVAFQKHLFNDITPTMYLNKSFYLENLSSFGINDLNSDDVLFSYKVTKDGSYEVGIGCVIDNIYEYGGINDIPIDGLLGIAEDNITDGNTGTICTLGIPLNQTKTGMSEELGWYSTGLSRIPLLQKKRDGSTGLWACPLSTEDLQIRPEAAGETSWMLG